MTKNRRDLTPRHVSKFTVGRAKPPPSANIKVVIRVRPPNSRETGDNHRLVVKCSEPNALTFDPEEEDTPFFFHGVKQQRRDLLKKQHKNLQFIYDRVFPESATNDEVFCYTTRNLIDILMDGCNCSVFAYGATGAGKTYTMLGKPSAPGITVLTIGELFARKTELSDTRDFELFVTYLEVYNENVRDLLRPAEKPLQLREDQVGVRVAGLTHRKINNADELFNLLDEGNNNRTQHPTDSNAESSRSHAVFQVYLKMNVKQTGQTIMAKLSMIDLAGSERGAATGCKGIRFAEGASINRSLLALGNCINSLADGQKHVPYRNSKLTRILKDSLGGNCHTVMIANVSPSSMTMEDTYNTLKYATRAKKIKANVKKNVIPVGKSSSEYIKVIEELNEEIRRLKEENTQLRESRSQVVVAAVAQSTADVEKEEITTTTVDSEKELTNVTFSCSSTVAMVEPTEDMIKNVKMLFESYKLLQNRLHSFVLKQELQDKRQELQEQEKARLDSLLASSQDKENNKRILEVLKRLRDRNPPYDSEIKTVESKIAQIKQQIKHLLVNNPELESTICVEQTKIDAIKAANDKRTFESLGKLQTSELQTRGEFMAQSGQLLQNWYAVLSKRGLVTKPMQDGFEKLLTTHALTKEDSGDSGLSTTSSSVITIPNAADVSHKRSGKRKLDARGDAAELDTTVVLSSTSRAKCVESSLFKEFQPTPSKRMAKTQPVRSSPRMRLQKENKATELLRKIRARPVDITNLARKQPPFR